MSEYLLFRLYGPMASWGDIAVGEVRPSFTHPSKSAILGLIAAALGIDRDQEERQQLLSDSYGFGVRIDSMGVPLVDYHTAQVPPSGSGRNRRTFATRRDELCTLPKDRLNTILSRRDYRMDALSTVVVWARIQTPPYSLEEIGAALDQPIYILYLGRKSCPLALPVEAQVIDAASICDALAKSKWIQIDVMRQLRISGAPVLCWEDGTDAGIPPQHVFERRDVPLSRRRWQFDVRQERQASLDREEG